MDGKPSMSEVEMFVSMSGTSWDRVLDSQAWVQRHGPILQGEVGFGGIWGDLGM